MLSRSLRILFGVMLAATLSSHDSIAQQFFDVGVTAPSSVTVGSTIQYTITVRNLSQSPVNAVSVISSFPSSLQFVSANPTNRGQFTTSAGTVTFGINSFGALETISFDLRLRTTQAGTVANTVNVTSGSGTPASASATTSVEEPTGQSDLSVTISPPSGQVFVNDWVPFSIRVANSGASVSGVFLTNILADDVLIQGHSPSDGVTINSEGVIFDLGTIQGNQSTNVQLTLQPTTTNLTLIARVNSAGTADTNLVNNSVTNMIAVVEPFTNQLEEVTRSVAILNRQNALWEQLITISNKSPSNAVSARVVLADFPHYVVNAVGTNDGFPYVVHAAPLRTNETVELLLEYFTEFRQPPSQPNLIIYSAGTISLTPPTNGTGISITNKWRRPSGSMSQSNLMIEFSAAPGATYQIVYMTNVGAARLKAMPPIVAQASRVQWIDYGPPKTLSRPFLGALVTTNTIPIATNVMKGMTNVITTNTFTTNMSMRFYQAFELH